MTRPDNSVVFCLFFCAGTLLPLLATADDDLSIRIVPGGTAESSVVDFQEPLRIVLTNTSDQPIHMIEEHDVDVDDFERGSGHPIIVRAVAWPDIVRLLIESGADLQTRITWRGFGSGITLFGHDATSLHFAAWYGVPESIDLLIEHGVDIFATAQGVSRDSTERTALEVAATLGKGTNAAAMLRRPEFRDGEQSSRRALLDRCLLLAACHYYTGSKGDHSERPELVAALLEAGADADAHHDDRGSAIQIAAREIRRGDDDENRLIQQTVANLIEHGATIDLFTAVAIGDADAVAGLLGEDPESADARSPNGYPALHFAASRGHEEIARLLIDAGADVNAVAERQSTPLHSAIRYTNVKVARLLLEYGAQIDARDENGETPLDWCEQENGYVPDEIRKLYLEFGQTVDR